MQSSYRVIKSDNVKNQGDFKIDTSYKAKISSGANAIIEAQKENFESYESLAKTIIDNARDRAEDIISNAYNEVQKIQEDAYREAYREGGEKGYKNAYDKTITEAQKEANEIKNQASQIYIKARQEYEKYLENKQDEILDLVIYIARKVLKKELDNKASVVNIVKETLSQYKDAKFFIIKSNKLYIETIKEQIEHWKTHSVFKGDIFYIEEETLNKGKVIIEKDNGKLVLDVEVALEKIKEIFMER